MVTNDIVTRMYKIQRIQEKRLIVMAILSVITVVEFSVIILSYYVTVPMWLIVINIVCILCNVPFICLVLELYVHQRKRDKNYYNIH